MLNSEADTYLATIPPINVLATNIASGMAYLPEKRKRKKEKKKRTKKKKKKKTKKKI